MSPYETSAGEDDGSYELIEPSLELLAWTQYRTAPIDFSFPSVHQPFRQKCMWEFTLDRSGRRRTFDRAKKLIEPPPQNSA